MCLAASAPVFHASQSSGAAARAAARPWRWLCGLPWLCLLWLGVGLPAQAQPAAAAGGGDAGWQLHRLDTATGTQVWLRDRGDAGPPAFRATTRLRTRLSALVAVLLDAERMPDWVFRTREVKRLQGSSATRGVSLVVTGMPWPLSDREAVVAWQFQQDPATLRITISGQAAPDGLAGVPPPAAERVRMPHFESRWQFTPLPDGQVEISFEGLGDPGGNLASPLLRAFVDAAVWQAPMVTVTGLRRMALLPEYQQAQVDHVREPSP